MFRIGNVRFRWRSNFRNRPKVWYFHNAWAGILHLGPVEIFYRSRRK